MMKQVLITAGPTFEPIDPVRFIGNRSSGKMGYSIAKAFLEKNYQVVLISGPTNEQLEHDNLILHKVETAEEMFHASFKYAETYNIAVLSAAVADFTPANVAHQKIKKTDGQNEMIITLKKTKDILKSLGSCKKENQLLVGFSLETNNALENAISKLENKKCDYIILNTLEDKGAGFGHNTNKVSILGKEGLIKSFPLMPKSKLGKELVVFLTE